MCAPGRWSLTPEEDGTFFIDRDPKAFPLILQCLRGQRINTHIISSKEMHAFRQDVDYYGLPADLLERCLDIKLGPAADRFCRSVSDGLSFSTDNLVVSYSTAYMYRDYYVLGANRYHKDHVVITLHIIDMASWIMLGVIGGAPQQSPSYIDSNNYAIATDTQYYGGLYAPLSFTGKVLCTSPTPCSGFPRQVLIRLNPFMHSLQDWRCRRGGD